MLKSGAARYAEDPGLRRDMLKNGGGFTIC